MRVKTGRFLPIMMDGEWWVVDTEPLIHNGFVNRNDAVHVCESLNSIMKSHDDESSFKEKVDKVIKELWDEDEIIVDYDFDRVTVTEISSTKVIEDDITSILPTMIVNTVPISETKSLFIISEEEV